MSTSKPDCARYTGAGNAKIVELALFYDGRIQTQRGTYINPQQKILYSSSFCLQETIREPIIS